MDQTTIKLPGGIVTVRMPHYRQVENVIFYKIISADKAIKVLNPKHSDIQMGREVISAAAAFHEDSKLSSEEAFNSAHFYTNVRMENLLK
jgi:hypothetical protein